MKDIGHRFASVAATLLIVSSAASFAYENRDGDNLKRNQVQKHDKPVLWHARGGNGCAVGNSPPPGSNC